MKTPIISAFCAMMILTSCQVESNKRTITVNYPKTEKQPVVDTYFNTEVIVTTDGWKTTEVKKQKPG